MHRTEKVPGKGPQLLRRFDQPVQHGIGVNLEDPRGGADAQPLSQARQYPHDQFHGRLFAMEERAVRLQKVPPARGTVELTPGTSIGMAIGP